MSLDFGKRLQGYLAQIHVQRFGRIFKDMLEAVLDSNIGHIDLIDTLTQPGESFCQLLHQTNHIQCSQFIC